MEIATREAYGSKLAELGGKHANIVVLDADLSGSTKTGVFAKKYPERFFNMGVAEQDMMGTAAGLATCGKTVFLSTFAIFASGRAWEPFRQSIAYPHLDVKVCATHSGLSVGEDGASHQAIEDISLMRTIPGVKVFVPVDGVETERMLEVMIQEPGPCYLRLGRAKSPVIYDASYRFVTGKGNILKKGNDICLFTMGYVTSMVLEAAGKLEAKGFSVSVVNLSSIKPIDEELIVSMAKSHKHLATVEEHSVIGGLGSAVAEVLVSHYPKKLLRLGVQDQFGQSGDALKVLAFYGLSADRISQDVQSAISEQKI